MKYVLQVLMVLTFITIGCNKNTTDSENDTDGPITHSTVNVKTATEYFSFSSNSGSNDESVDYDVVFYSVMWTPPGAPVTINDPRFRAKDGLSIAVLNESNLEDVTDVPALGEFVPNFISQEGEWYYPTSANLVLPNDNVYIVNTTDGKFPAFVIKSYYDEQGIAGVFNLEWKYLSE